MKDLIIKRPKQAGKMYDKNLKVVIDGTHQIEIANGESKSIQLEEGEHSIQFEFYYKGSNEDIEMPMPSLFKNLASMLEINLKQDEIIELHEATECDVRISNQLKIKISTSHSTKEVSSKASSMISSKTTNWIKTFFYALGPVGVFPLLFSALFAVGVELWRFELAIWLMISCVLYAIILFTIPTLINASRTRKLDRTSADEAGKKYDKYISQTIIAMIAIVVMTTIIAFFFDKAFTIYIICALLSICIAEFIIIRADFNISPIKVFGIALVVALLLTIITYILPKGDRVGDTCGSCGGSGYFFDKQCPSCHGFGIYVD